MSLNDFFFFVFIEKMRFHVHSNFVHFYHITDLASQESKAKRKTRSTG